MGHKSPNCPKKKKSTVRKIEIPIHRVMALNENKVMAEISGIAIPLTIYSGAQMTIVQLEAVKPEELTGV